VQTGAKEFAAHDRPRVEAGALCVADFTRCGWFFRHSRGPFPKKRVPKGLDLWQVIESYNVMEN
jgi:hypothetical protein